MSGLIADRFRINDRGKVFVGNYADLNMFKLDEINDTTKETGWTWPSTGMKYVMNSGEFLIDDYKMTGNLPGKGLRKTDYVNQKKSINWTIILLDIAIGLLVIGVIALVILILIKRKKTPQQYTDINSQMM